MTEIHTSTKPSKLGFQYLLNVFGANGCVSGNKVVIGNGSRIIKMRDDVDTRDFVVDVIKKEKTEKQVELVVENYMTEHGTKVNVEFDLFKIMNDLIYRYDSIFTTLKSSERRIFAMSPVVDIAILALEKWGSIERKSLWPSNRKFALCLTHDVDELKKTYQYLTHSVAYLRRGKLSRAIRNLLSFVPDKLFGRNPYWTFEKIQRLESDFGVRSTFFFLKESAKVNVFDKSSWKHYARKYDWFEKKVRDKILELHRNGWEVALHGSYYSYRDPALLSREKRELESIVGTVVGVRQHNLNLDVPETWYIQKSVGFKYDMSFGFKGTSYIGFKGGVSYPFFPVDGLLEIPTTIMDITILGGYGQKDFENILKTVEQTGGVCNILWHHTVFSDEHGWDKMYVELIRTAVSMGAWVCTGREILDVYRRRQYV